jgi:Putative transposase
MQPAAATYNLNDWGNPSTEVRVGSTPSKKSIEGRDRYKQMTLATFEFIHRFLIHVLPKGLHRVRHYGLLASSRAIILGPRPDRIYKPSIHTNFVI